MEQYTYAYDLKELDEEVFFVFRSFPEIVSALSKQVFDLMGGSERQAFAEDAVLTALQSIISVRDELPTSDNPDTLRASGFVYLSPLQAMKLQLFRVYADNCTSVADFARRIEKQDTAARRLLKLRHHSSVEEIEEALSKFGIKLVHKWATTQEPLKTNGVGHKQRQVADADDKVG
jgi:hypothetical protein